MGCTCCKTFESTIPSIGNPQSPSVFHPNFVVKTNVILPTKDINLAREKLFHPDGIESIVMLSPIARSFTLSPKISKSDDKNNHLIDEPSCFTFSEVVPFLCFHITVNISAQQQIVAECDLIYESYASAGVHVRKRRRLMKLDSGEIEVQEVMLICY